MNKKIWLFFLIFLFVLGGCSTQDTDKKIEKTENKKIEKTAKSQEVNLEELETKINQR